MEKRRKWQLSLILAVLALTVYNILPTLVYYAKPLKQGVDAAQGKKIAASIAERVSGLERESKEWLSSFCDLIAVKPLSISSVPEDAQTVALQFAKTEEADRFRRFLPKAGSLIPFAPAQLQLAHPQERSKQVLVQRQCPEGVSFSFVSKKGADGKISAEYREILFDRAAQIAAALGGTSESASLLMALEANQAETQVFAIADSLASRLEAMKNLSGTHSGIAKRVAGAFTQGNFPDRKKAVRALAAAFDSLRDRLKKEKSALMASLEEDTGREELAQQFGFLEKKESRLMLAGNALKKQEPLFAAGKDPLDTAEAIRLLAEGGEPKGQQTLPLGGRNPLFSELVIDWDQEQILFRFHPDIASQFDSLRNQKPFQQLLIDEMAKVNRMANENPVLENGEYAVSFHRLAQAQSFLVLDLEKAGRSEARKMAARIQANWHPQHQDLKDFSIVDAEEYETLSPEQKALCLVFGTGGANGITSQNLPQGSLYAVVKGVDKILQAYEQEPASEQARLFASDFRSLSEALRSSGFEGPLSLAGRQNFLFQKTGFYRPLLAATREEFAVAGTQKYAVLELSDLEHRLAVENKIETQIHEDLLKWKDEYLSAQVSLNPGQRYEVPQPTRSVFWSNVQLTLRKLLRGDEKKVLRWGLDLSGGKTVQIELRDANQQPVKSEADLKQGINELYNRVNKMGVSEVAIRQVGSHIVLDFPGAQSLSAAELIKASSMYFHVVNEKFSSGNPLLAESVGRFLQEVWNEAVVTKRTDPQSINAIAWEHLYGDQSDQKDGSAARTLIESGLQLASPEAPAMSHAVDMAVSKIAVLRGAGPHDWHGQPHPLLFVFNNYALEGSQLENVRSNYDPSKGNYLSFEVSGASLSRDGVKSNPRNELYAWTSRFAKERIQGTPHEAYTHGRGWRMAVLLNDTVISCPTLDAALRDSAMISGNFSLREVTQLAADLKAGSLTFTPHILSEKNVSPELGKADRAQGIAATIAALLLVVVSMVLYYRFAGWVASVAVFFNLLILWAVLQNLGAALSLAGIAGVILTVAMAIDANVLVFERIKEEYALTGRIASAIDAGYQKAYSAIIDSNATTLIAALILMNFDAGPIKGFAITLIIGLASSMFTALFMTRFYFTGWAQNPKNTLLSMGKNWFRAQKIDFLKRAKLAFAVAFSLIALGGFFTFTHRDTIFGMDFTGGFSLDLEVQKNEVQKNSDFDSAVSRALLACGASHQDFQIRELHSPAHLRLLFGSSMEQKGKPFFQMPLEKASPDARFSYEKNPRIVWVVDALQAQGISLAPDSLPQLDANWTSMSGQMSDAMRNHALMGLLLSFAFIFVYIAFRFEYKFAAASILCLLHDVLVTLGLIGVLHAFGVPLQIDLNTVAAIMTIVGYSLNDTIIIFDRIREEMKLSPGQKLAAIVNRSLNITLSRTTITSGTTLLVLIALVLIGGASLLSFALVMTIGVFFGTLSSWYIAAPLMLFFHKREEAREAKENDLAQPV